MFEQILISGASGLPLAYIDPGTGQVVLYALAAAGMSLMFRFRQLKTWIANKFSRSQD